MRNHHEKTRDMARSVLPSNARKGARKERAVIHGRERAHERQVLHDLRRGVDPDGYGDLGVSDRHRRDVVDMVADRRAADKVGPLLRWADRTVERDPKLLAASAQGREAHFRAVLPPGLIGDHAITHLHRLLEDGRTRRFGRARPRDPGADVALVLDIIAAGRHGELNRRIRGTGLPMETSVVLRPPYRLVDDDHPHPGMLVPREVTFVRSPRPVRYLAGAHDAEAFVGDASFTVLEVLRALHAETIGPAGPRMP